MTKESRQALALILSFINDKNNFFTWLLIRIIGVLLPPFSLYIVSRIISCLETNSCPTSYISSLGIVASGTYVFYHIAKNISLHRLQFITNKSECDIQAYLIEGIHAKTIKKRHSLIQSIRNFSEAARTTVETLLNQGVDGLVTLVYVPILIFILDFRVFMVLIAFILIYYFTDVYTTEKYRKLKHGLNLSVEKYYAKLQDSNSISEENLGLISDYKKISQWGSMEWNILSLISVAFYATVLMLLINMVLHGDIQVSKLVLLLGYTATMQNCLETLSQVKDKLTDTKVALSRLLKSKHFLDVDFSTYLNP